LFELNNFESIQIALASPEKILEWSKGEVKKPETINYRTLKPEKDGLFCEKIFGPTKDYECNCGKYRKDKLKHRGVICDKCGVEVTSSKVRRERMGHIKLAAPVSHIWYFKGVPSRMGILLDISPKELEKVLYFASYIVLDAGETNLLEKQILTEKEYKDAIETFGYGSFNAMMGAEAVKVLLSRVDLDALSQELKAKFKDSTGQKRIKLVRRLDIVESFRKSGNNPTWMILDVIPVIPPDLRPMVQLDGGRFATSDLNDLYRRVINRNNRLQRLLELGAPDIIVRNEKRMLQESVDALIDNGRRGKPVAGPGNRPLKSLTDMLKGKQGRFRQNLLGKRVDYSGRSVIVVGPTLKFNQCGLPKKMALELFKPFVMNELVKRGFAHNVKAAKKKVEKLDKEVWPILEDVIKGHPVMLNRAPTLHRLGIQAFEPVLVDGKAIKLHPLVCTAYNADFDGDQMAVHVPLSVESQYECRSLMLSTNNILAPKDGLPITTPTQDMILGTYYLTLDEEGVKGEGSVYKDFDEMILAYENGEVNLHARVKVKVKKNPQDEGRLVESTVGRFIFNNSIPQDLGYVDRTIDPYSLEVDFVLDKKQIGVVIDKCYRKHGNELTSIMLDNIKNMGYKYSTKSAISVSVADMEIPDEKYELIENTEKLIEKYEKNFRRGLMSDEERYEKVIEAWAKTTDDVTNVLMAKLGRLNNINIMAQSGARGSKNQIKQLAGMRGLMANASGKTVEIPVKSNFREGLSVLEYFTSSHGARKGLADTALRTADSGYLTRRLVDVSQDVIINEEDCGTTDGIEVSAFVDGSEEIEKLYDRIVGRYALLDVINPQDDSIVVQAGEMIVEPLAEKIVELGIEKVWIRTPMDCKSKQGICAKCYGRNLATGNKAPIGESVGIIAAQSIGEPGTQLTMRTFHTGGVAGGDITQGLPRVEELFEARKPKGLAVITEVAGVVTLEEVGRKKEAVVIDDNGYEYRYIIPYGSILKFKDGQRVEAGYPLTQGSINPHDILRVNGIQGVQNYIVKEVQRVYRLQGVDINDKHIEIIVRQMMQKAKVEEPGDTELLPGGMIDIREIERINEQMRLEGKEEAQYTRMLQGITKAALSTDSFLSAASFQETTKVLTDAAIKGSKDYLRGLKENVIIGKLIPAGSVLRRKKQRQQQAIQNALLEESYMNYNFEEYDQMEDPIEIEDTDMDF
jgi:DNA-directed RNA polymerase, beta' subunit